MFDGSFGLFVRIILFRRRETSVEKMLAVRIDHFFDPRDLDQIDAVSDDGHFGFNTRKSGEWPVVSWDGLEILWLLATGH